MKKETNDALLLALVVGFMGGVGAMRLLTFSLPEDNTWALLFFGAMLFAIIYFNLPARGKKASSAESAAAKRSSPEKPPTD